MEKFIKMKYIYLNFPFRLARDIILLYQLYRSAQWVINETILQEIKESIFASLIIYPFDIHTNEKNVFFITMLCLILIGKVGFYIESCNCLLRLNENV